MNCQGNKRIGVLLGSASLVVLIGSQYLNEVLNLYVSRNSGFFAPIIVVAAILGIVGIGLERRIMFNYTIVLVIFLLLSTYCLTELLQSGKTSLKLVDFFGMCILPMSLGAFLFVDYGIVLRGCMYLLVLSIPVFHQLFFKANAGLAYDAVSMSTSYDILPIVVAGLIHFIFFHRESKLLDKVLYFVSFVYAASFVGMSYRGALFAFIISVLSAVYFQIQGVSRKRMLMLVVIALFVFILFFYYEYVLVCISDFFYRYGIKVAFIDKSIYLLASEATSHGRGDIYQQAFQGFMVSPIWGNGMATFQYYTSYPFPHNFILEFLFDGGLILSIPLLMVFVKAVKQTFIMEYSDNKKRFAVVLMIGCISVTRGLFSSECWRIVLLWLFLGLALNENRETLENCGQYGLLIGKAQKR